MGLTGAAVGKRAAADMLERLKRTEENTVVALVGNPNVGKSTLFNALTGLNQHTGNWPGKTVTLAAGRFFCGGKSCLLVDLPGTYSLVGASPEEQVTAEFLRSGQADVILAVCDATCLARSLSLVMQLGKLPIPVVVCLNLMDEAERGGAVPDGELLSRELGMPVAAAAAGKGRGLEELKKLLTQAERSGDEGHTECQRDDADSCLREGQRLAALCCRGENTGRQTRLDRFLTGRVTGSAVMLLLLFAVFWLTLRGANLPSALLQRGFDALGSLLWRGAGILGLPRWLTSPLLDGVYATTAVVISVMLPPMAIFFPLFTLLEDLGYLPRAAFLMDERFRKCGSCGKQALTMCMGFGCNAAGVVGCRIIETHRERRIAILTNALVPCNGRFPMLIALLGAFFTGSTMASAGLLTMLVLLSAGVTLLTSLLLSKTVYRGQEAAFMMEIPPFRRPRVLQILYRSFVDRSLYILGRAAAVAAPAGLVLWCMTEVRMGGTPLLERFAALMEPVGALLGVPGAVPAAFVLGFPANELVLPVLLTALGAETAAALPGLGWTWQTALCTMLLCLFHWPCSTTCLTVWKETESVPVTVGAILLPTLTGMLLSGICCGIFHLIA